MSFDHGVLHERYFDRSARRSDPRAWESTGPAMVVSAHYLASAAGAGMLRQGGNAVDAAVAASLALTVCEAAGSGIGGMGMMLVYLAERGRCFTIEGSCRVPENATPENVANAESRYHGYAAVATPGLVGALAHALSRYGTMSLDTVITPAIELARRGVPVTALQHRLQRRYARHLSKRSAGRLILDDHGRPRAPGKLFRQPLLANTLARLRRAGLLDFYYGETADRILRDMAENAGFVTARDLARSAHPRESDPLRIAYGGGTAVSVGPPAGGLCLLQLLALAQSIGSAALDPDTPEGIVTMARLIQRARADRRRYRLRSGAEHPAESLELLETRRVEAAAARVRHGLAAGGETSHLCVADARGNWVSMTQSIERSFGACVAALELGFIWNGYLRACKIVNRRHPYFLRPGIPARSNAAPTLLTRDGRPYAALGSTGSERIQSGIFEVILRLGRESPFAATHAPRLHCTPEGGVYYESARFPAACIEALRARGFELHELAPYSFKMGGLQLLVRDDHGYTGVSEPRRDGAAMAPETCTSR